MKNYKLELMYDGTHFSGWQTQKNARTVCGEVETAISTIVRHSVELIGISRTDAGVHALCYTANAHLETDLEERKLFAGINALLPSDISLKSIEICPDSFHSRFDVISKTYLYTIDNSAYGDVFMEKYAWHFKYPLDIEAMQKASRHFIGTHDFSAFMAQGGSAKTFVRTIFDCSVKKSGDVIKILVRGDGFLYNMVRIMAGTLVWVGKGAIEESDIPKIIASQDRTQAGITAPPQGLCLYKTEYPL